MEGSTSMHSRTNARAGVLAVCVLCMPHLRADGPRDNDLATVRQIPPPGIELADDVRAELTTRLGTLAATLAATRTRDPAPPAAALADTLVFWRAVDVALRDREFFDASDIATARAVLAEGERRADLLLSGETRAFGDGTLLALGFVSRIDRTVQPYGLVVPASYRPDGERRHRLDIWLHGRGETLSEMRFLAQRMRSAGDYAPADTFVLHPYGRYSNAFKFAGEVDVFEALDDVKARFRIDDDRIAVRGFSMGGAGCWQLAVHCADRWFAANPGAGFAETPEFLRVFQKETLRPTAWEKSLWQLYDCPGQALNLVHCPTVAYSGELDTQKQAADIMEAALAGEGIDLVHVIGPATRHSIHPDAKLEIERRLASLAERGRERMPRRVRFTTCTLAYPRMHWVALDGLGEHWKPARVEADIEGNDGVVLRTTNVTALTLEMAPGWSPFAVEHPVQVAIDGAELTAPRPRSDRSWTCALHRDGERWALGKLETEGLRKRPGLQGPIDDAFLDSFIIVAPSGTAAHPAVESWTRAELTHAVEHWRRHFRGDARVKLDREIDDADIRDANLILFGDPTSNQLLAKIAPDLPIGWTRDAVTVGEQRFDAAQHALVLIHPNPLDPARYVVINSGFTFREYDYLNNARQAPKLPDWAVIDLSSPPDARSPGKVASADFFDERWKLR